MNEDGVHTISALLHLLEEEFASDQARLGLALSSRAGWRWVQLLSKLYMQKSPGK